MSVSIAEVKEYCHAEGESDATMGLYLGMAEDYLAGAGVTEELATAEGYGLTAKALTLHFYDHRGGAPIPNGLQDYITQQQKRCRKAALAVTAAEAGTEETPASGAAESQQPAAIPQQAEEPPGEEDAP